MYKKYIKRLLDIIISIIVLVIIWPLYIIIVLLLKITTNDEIFYNQIRTGKDAKEFKIYKFKTMNKDKKVTKIGKFLRNTSLDELPQFINVLVNDMSLIGPRPLVEGELEKHQGKARIYESIKPGITGWWACNGRSDTTYKRRLELEYYYIKNCSLLMDIAVIFLTIKAVLFKTGAK